MADGVSVLELLARGGAVGAFMGLGIVCARARLTPARVTGILFCLAAAAHTLTQYQPIEDAFVAVWPVVWSFSAMGAGFFWLFTTELFADRPRLEPMRLAPAAFLLGLAVVGNHTAGALGQGAWLAHNFIGAALMAHILVNRRPKLTPDRRRKVTPLDNLFTD